LPLLLAVMPAAAPAIAQDPGAAAAANNFYAAALALPREGLPGPAARTRLVPLMSARLAGLMDRALAAQNRFRAGNRLAPALLEGDLYSSSLEGAASFRLGACTGSATAQRCRVQFHRPPQPAARGLSSQSPAPPTDWNDDLLLVNEGGAWKVDDVDYRGGFASGNTGLLSQSLSMVIRSAS
jgi:hypothetical protein